MIAERDTVRQEQDPARSLLRELRGYLDPGECGAPLCICGIPDADPCPLCHFVRQMDEVLTVPVAAATKGRYLPAQVTIWPGGVTLTGSARIRANGWLDVEVARPPSMAGLHSYPPHRVGGVEWLPESWEVEE